MIAVAQPEKFVPLPSKVAFPGRHNLYPHEVCSALRVDRTHLQSLIEEGLIKAVRINGAGNKSERSNYRIPVCEYDRFILQGGTPKTENREPRIENRKNGKAKR